MGFGLLLIGYFTATLMSLHSLGGVFRVVGYSIVVFASKKLAQYNKSFYALLGTAVAMLMFSLFSAANDLSSFLYNNLLIPAPLVPDNWATGINTVKAILDLCFVSVLCLSVNSIARETGAKKIVYTSIRNLVFYGISFVLQIVIWLAIWTDWSALASFVMGTMLPVWMVIINLICMILITVMLFSCYAKICDADDTEMKQKPSRFAFINRMRAAREAKTPEIKPETATEIYSEEQKARSAATHKNKKKSKK